MSKMPSNDRHIQDAKFISEVFGIEDLYPYLFENITYTINEEDVTFQNDDGTYHFVVDRFVYDDTVSFNLYVVDHKTDYIFMIEVCHKDVEQSKLQTWLELIKYNLEFWSVDYDE